MKSATLSLSLLAILLQGCVSNASTAQVDLSKYELVFEDQFDSLDISPSGPGTKWIAHTPWGGDFGEAKFTDPGPNGPFSVSDGILSIEARKVNGKWQSGLIASMDTGGGGFGQQYGYFEMRAKLPPGKGLWPAFWLNSYVPSDAPTPAIEVDVIEHYGHFPNAYEALVHIWPRPEKDNAAARRKVIEVPAGSLYSDFHVYGVDVSPDWITVFLDGEEKWRYPTPPIHKSKLMLLVNLAMGSGWPIDETPSPSVMQVDYVRAYKKITGPESPTVAR